MKNFYLINGGFSINIYKISIKIMKNFYLINGGFSINIYKMAIKCITIILLLFKYKNNGEYE